MFMMILIQPKVNRSVLRLIIYLQKWYGIIPLMVQVIMIVMPFIIMENLQEVEFLEASGTQARKQELHG